jgi:hypothetical protein
MPIFDGSPRGDSEKIRGLEGQHAALVVTVGKFFANGSAVTAARRRSTGGCTIAPALLKVTA